MGVGGTHPQEWLCSDQDLGTHTGPACVYSSSHSDTDTEQDVTTMELRRTTVPVRSASRGVEGPFSFRDDRRRTHRTHITQEAEIDRRKEKKKERNEGTYLKFLELN